MKCLKRDYLTSEEKNFYMVTKAFIQMVQGERTFENHVTDDIWEEWKNRGMITSKMQRSLKTATTNLKNFCYELEDNLSETTLKTLQKQLEKFDYKIIDDFTLSKIFRDASDSMKYAVIEREKLEPILQDIAAVRCVGCTSCYEKCPLYHMLDDISTPFVGEESNCPYAVVLDKFTDDELNHIQKLKDIVNGRHSVTESFNRRVEYDVITKPSKMEKNMARNPGGCNNKYSQKNKQRSSKRKGHKKNRK
ncbi:MAG: DUF5651 domain-containing protein [Bacilli bacterium]